ncbi:MAG TPA: substrate-binding domain-containing protein [Ohtaekwangia sp.]|nr:substrate-binding domain-containing protein [Ohtaekwangia sp.]
MKKKVVISDIAKKLGVSITTVSFILNGKAKEKRISESVTKEVTMLIEELGYKPDALAKSLRTGKTNVIGLIVEDISNPFFSGTARLIEENAYKHGYRILYCSTENKVDKTKELIRMFRERKVDGYIITPAEGVEEDVAILLKNNLPVVLFDRYFPGLETNYVVIDNYNAVYDATIHLYDQGFSNIGFVTIESIQTQMQERLNGYMKAQEKFRKEPLVEEVSFSDDYSEMVRAIAQFIERNPQMDAIMFGTNYLGVRGLAALKALNINIAEKMGVVSFDDHEIFGLYSPSITAIAQPIEEISRQLIKILLEQLDSSTPSGITSLSKLNLKADLIVRDSTRRRN